MQEGRIEISYKECTFPELDKNDQFLIEQAELASNDAFAPYSHFKVGAAVLMDNGEIVIGNNQENSAYPSGLCAERVALFSACSRFPDAKVIGIALTAQSESFKFDGLITPCGACRQVMAEYENKSKNKIRVIMKANNEKILIMEGVNNLLPFMFHENKLKKKS